MQKTAYLLSFYPWSAFSLQGFFLFISDFMKKYLLKLALQVLKVCCDWLSDYIGTLPSNAISNALKCAPFCKDE